MLSAYRLPTPINEKWALPQPTGTSNGCGDNNDARAHRAQIEDLPQRWHNFLDLQTAIELYTPLFALLLSREDFERASNSLQLDETIALYVATLFDKGEIIGLVCNKHPMVPFSTIEAGFRLMLHGLDAENLYGFIKFSRDQQAA